MHPTENPADGLAQQAFRTMVRNDLPQKLDASIRIEELVHDWLSHDCFSRSTSPSMVEMT